MKNILRHGIIPIVHILLIVFLCITPWILPWQYILVIFILYRLQLIIFSGCILSNLQFGPANEGFYYHYIKKICPNVRHATINIIVDTILPLVIILVAYVLQS